MSLQNEKDKSRTDGKCVGRGVSPDVSRGDKELPQQSKPNMGEASETPEEHTSIQNKIKLIAHKERLEDLLQKENVDAAIKCVRKGMELFDSTEVVYARDVRTFVGESEGWFRIGDVYLALNIKERKEKQNVSRVLRRLVEDGVLQRHPKFSGSYRRKEQHLDVMEWRTAPLTPVDIVLPLGINDFAQVYEGTILVFAGTPDAGKTALFLDVIKRNMSINKIHLFNSEMSEQELRIRIEQHEDISPDEWSFNPYHRSSNFGDCIFPNDINIVDYLDLGDDIPALSRYLREIHEALDKGIALVGLQKPYGRDIGYGKELGLQLPRLYVSLEYKSKEKMSRATIVKCKSRKTTESMIGKVVDYKLYDAWKFEQIGAWHYPEDELKFTRS